MSALGVVAFIAGALLVLGTLRSAVRTVIVPRAEQSWLNRVVFGVLRPMVVWLARRRKAWDDQDRTLARFAPFALVLMPVAWSIGVVLGNTLMFWGLDRSLDRPTSWGEALLLSGSSLTTLGFRTSSSTFGSILAIGEALIGLGLVALMISFLPAMYAAFSRRETAVYRMAIRTTGDDTKPSHAALFTRWWIVGAYDRFDELWDEWELWFVEIEETHTSFPALAFFRSPKCDRSWITAAGFALDIASLHMAVLNVGRQPKAALMVRSGFLSLRAIADFFQIPYDANPAPDAPISITKAEFLDFYEEVAAAGVPVRPNREQAWRDFAGWRVNYDDVLLGLCRLTLPPEAPWSSDRMGQLAADPAN